jgi:hypothetical protein
MAQKHVDAEAAFKKQTLQIEATAKHLSSMYNRMELEYAAIGKEAKADPAILAKLGVEARPDTPAPE